MEERFDPELLDPEEPFEIDWPTPHLFKHETLGIDDALDVFACDPVFYPARPDGGADWLMVAEVPGGDVLVVPLAKSRHGDDTKARPLGVYRAGERLKTRYLADR